ncbi:MAG: hypothetical protein ACOXZ4_00315 [Sphaerochaetaceae bacterium]
MMQQVQKQFEQLPPDASDQQIQQTAASLQRRHWEPTLLFAAEGFALWKRADMWAEYVRLSTLEDGDQEIDIPLGYSLTQAVAKQLELLLYHYKLLCQLRLGHAEAWDVIHELYEDD